jgi:hypothetical protein
MYSLQTVAEDNGLGCAEMLSSCDVLGLFMTADTLISWSNESP